MEKSWYTYLLECADGSLYCGVTIDVAHRLEAHNAGSASRCTRTRLPVRLLAVSRPLTKKEAMGLEWHIKRLPRRQKLKVLNQWTEELS